MIQWLQSKLVLIMAGVVLISSVTAVFNYQLESMEREELENRCEKISRVIDKMDRADVDEMRQKITFDENSEGIYLPPQVRDESYTIKIQTDFVRIVKDDESVVEALQGNVHLWSPSELNNTGELNEDERRWRDSQNSSLEIRSGNGEIELLKIELQNSEINRPHIFISEVDST